MAKFKHFDDITPAEQISRWSNVIRVLQALTPHQRKKHWNMEFWGVKTECGTIACAAGHCGLDPWFKRQGFKLIPAIVEKGLNLKDYYGGAGDFEDAPSGDQLGPLSAACTTVRNFFGYNGAKEIFYNDKKRPVTRVIKEVQAYVNALIADDAVDAASRKADAASLKYCNLVNS